MPAEDFLEPRALDLLTGSEPLGPATVKDFWQWALGDLRMNNSRGYLVEWLVARAVGDTSPLRVEWGPWDVRAEDGTLIEIKACGRLQSWVTKRLSTPTWTFKSVRTDRIWSPDVGDYVSVEPGSRVHVWVFALQTAEDPKLYDPLDLDQWEFRVMPHRMLLATGQVTASLPFFERHGVAPVAYRGLPAAVAAARKMNDELTA